MREQFDFETQPKADTLADIERANDIIEDYLRQGYRLTLRQLYYRFVASGWIANDQRSYKRLGKVIDTGRMVGLIDWEAIEDRTRNLGSVAHWERPDDIIDGAARSFRLDKWDGQPNRVEVWVEKEALAGVVEKACRECDVPWFPCRGYASQSSMYEAGKRVVEYLEDGAEVVTILHLGDHDPSGIDMTRDVRERLELLSGRPDQIDVERIALNMDQVEAYNPPPNPAKVTDSRVKGYRRAFGNQSWELDALPPSDLHELIVEHVKACRDDELYADRERLEREYRRDLADAADRWSSVSDFLNGG